MRPSRSSSTSSASTATTGFPLDLDDLVAGADADDPARGLDATTVYMLAATSGTTGVSKAAVLTNGNALAAITCYAAELPDRRAPDRAAEHPAVLQPGWSGRAAPGPGQGRPHRDLSRASSRAPSSTSSPVTGCNHTILVPTMIRMVLDHPAAATADLSTPAGRHLRRVPGVQGAPARRPPGVRQRVLPDLRHGRDVLVRPRPPAREPAPRRRRRRRAPPRFGGQATRPGRRAGRR